MQRRDLAFRVFVRSTFSELVAERNALQEQVFPRLHEVCQKREARFQAIDLRWGVSEEAALDQRTMNICPEELRCCTKRKSEFAGSWAMSRVWQDCWRIRHWCFSKRDGRGKVCR